MTGIVDTNEWKLMARQLVTLELAGDEALRDETITQWCRDYPTTAAPGVMRILAISLAHTWDDLEEFSAAMIALDAKYYGDDD